MFTLEEINAIHDEFGNAETLGPYLRALSAIGVIRCESFICDGHTEYAGRDGRRIVAPAAHELLTVAEPANQEEFIRQLELAGEGKSSYLEMSMGLAGSGIEKWVFDTVEMTMTYYACDGTEMLVEEIS